MPLPSVESVHPQRDLVLVKLLDPETISAGGIIIPESVQKRSKYATVLKVGPGKLLPSGERRPLEVRPGDVVAMTEYSTTVVELDVGRCHMLPEEEILGMRES